MHGDGVPPPPASEPAPDPTLASTWTRQQDKLLELLLCHMYPRWDDIAAHLGSKTADQACRRYESMVADLRRVLEAPEVQATPPEWNLLPALADGGEAVSVDDGAPTGGDSAVAAEDAGAPAVVGEAPATTVAGGNTLEEAVMQSNPEGERKRTSVQTKRIKARPWTRDEHRLFLEGIRKYGKGGWQRLSSEFVRTRSATQIASHYQKYAIRQAKRRRNECKRPSIHDINDTVGVPVPIVAGQPSGSAAERSDEQPAAAEGKGEPGTADDSEGKGEPGTARPRKN